MFYELDHSTVKRGMARRKKKAVREAKLCKNDKK